ncbi:N-methyl-D-aspartate receptor NMDAR2C subunit [archaeon]|nr:N-methyl-D-aspartate receptor NMDAR2C subunit [archaeon]MBT3578042.1 N-methyl-D-aspartate receptor NMDAR2C subunit [archaeon]MBT6819985.1 N-methyl-D-aspartate receptor NMDAR2C subunit [archaeon]MBT6956066.1 N-methyl-D-aspartate receptor NMDAR2C subunit [archaeon]MBT7025022.1 N-methyl-D-aspartate receptor NMDAR2C subunit [archaeon]
MEKDRHYHNLDHVGECLRGFEKIKYLSEDPLALEVALIGHDVIYDTGAKDNEQKSAKYMARVLLWQEAPSSFISHVKRIILATDHMTPVENIDEALATDIDLSIFGNPADAFTDYCNGIRKEYSWVSEGEYRERRAAVLKGFLDRPEIYHTEYFQKKYEEQARVNLKGEIRDLEIYQNS